MLSLPTHQLLLTTPLRLRVFARHHTENKIHLMHGWKWINLNFKGNPLLSALSQSQLDQLQVEYTEIEKLATNKGVWEDTTIFFVRAQK